MILKGFMGKGPDKNPYTKEAMAWKIFQLLPELIKTQKDEFLQISRYLASETSGVDADRSFRIRTDSDTFDSISDLPSEVILDWQAGKHPDGSNR